MKKLIMTFLVAGLIIVSAVSFSSCKKTDTDADWTPTTYDYFSFEKDDPIPPSWIICAYDFCNDTIYACDHVLEWQNNCFLCEVHSHEHWFEPNDDCTLPGQVGECRYKFVRRHKHVMTYSPYLYGFFHHSFHAGGAGGGHH